jgi:hypothetical protein
LTDSTRHAISTPRPILPPSRCSCAAEGARKKRGLEARIKEVFLNQDRLRENIKAFEKIGKNELLDRYLGDMGKEEDEVQRCTRHPNLNLTDTPTDTVAWRAHSWDPTHGTPPVGPHPWEPTREAPSMGAHP